MGFKEGAKATRTKTSSRTLQTTDLITEYKISAAVFADVRVLTASSDLSNDDDNGIYNVYE